MIEQRLLTLLKLPYFSEKASTMQGVYRQYVFKVVPEATKPLIRQAVETLLKVKVRSVRVCNVKSKAAGRSSGKQKSPGRHSGWKKAYVTLQSNEEIDLAGKL